MLPKIKWTCTIAWKNVYTCQWNGNFFKKGFQAFQVWSLSGSIKHLENVEFIVDWIYSWSLNNVGPLLGEYFFNIRYYSTTWSMGGWIHGFGETEDVKDWPPSCSRVNCNPLHWAALNEPLSESSYWENNEYVTLFNILRDCSILFPPSFFSLLYLQLK